MEYWDVYDSNRRKTGKLHLRGQMLGAGEYHLVVGIVVYNTDGQILITKRAQEKDSDPGRWESTAGAVQAGEDSLQGACRELREETGITASPQKMQLVYQASGRGRTGGALIDIYTVQMDVPLDEIRLQPGETCDAKWIEGDQWLQDIQSGAVQFPGWDKKAGIAKAVQNAMNHKETGQEENN